MTRTAATGMARISRLLRRSARASAASLAGPFRTLEGPNLRGALGRPAQREAALSGGGKRRPWLRQRGAAPGGTERRDDDNRRDSFRFVTESSGQLSQHRTAAPAKHQAHAAEAEEHQPPGRRFGNGRRSEGSI